MKTSAKHFISLVSADLLFIHFHATNWLCRKIVMKFFMWRTDSSNGNNFFSGILLLNNIFVQRNWCYFRVVIPDRFRHTVFRDLPNALLPQYFHLLPHGSRECIRSERIHRQPVIIMETMNDVSPQTHTMKAKKKKISSHPFWIWYRLLQDGIAVRCLLDKSYMFFMQQETVWIHVAPFLDTLRKHTCDHKLNE